MSGRTRAKATIVLSVAGLLALGGWAAETPEPDQAAQVPAEIPAAAKRMRNPIEATPESIENGKLIYSSQCVMCHGASGDGKGDLALRLNYTMGDFRAAATQKARTDGEWFYILTNGHGKMTGEGERLSEKVRWNLVNYLRALGSR